MSTTYHVAGHARRSFHGRYWSVGHVIASDRLAPGALRRTLCGIEPSGRVEDAPLTAVPGAHAVGCLKCRNALARRLTQPRA